MIEVTLFAYLMIIVAYSIFLVAAYREPKVGVLAILAGVATVALGVVTASQSLTLLGIAMLVMGIAPLVPVAVKAVAEEEE